MSEKALKIVGGLYDMAHDPAVWIGTAHMAIIFSPEHIMEWGLKVFFGLPAAVYMCFKIYYEFLKTPKSKKQPDEN